MHLSTPDPMHPVALSTCAPLLLTAIANKPRARFVVQSSFLLLHLVCAQMYNPHLLSLQRCLAHNL